MEALSLYPEPSIKYTLPKAQRVFGRMGALAYVVGSLAEGKTVDVVGINEYEKLYWDHSQWDFVRILDELEGAEGHLFFRYSELPTDF